MEIQHHTLEAENATIACAESPVPDRSLADWTYALHVVEEGTPMGKTLDLVLGRPWGAHEVVGREILWESMV